MDTNKRNGLVPIIAQAIEEMEVETGFSIPLENDIVNISAYLMKQIGNLAIVCARRKDGTLRIERGRVMVLLDGTYAPTAFSADWDDDETILSVIHELNFGRCTPKSQ